MPSRPMIAHCRLLRAAAFAALFTWSPLGSAQESCEPPPGGEDAPGGESRQSPVSRTSMQVRQHTKTETYHGFSEFVPSGAPGRPKKYAMLTWSGTLQEHNAGPDFIGGAKTEFSGTYTWSGATTTNTLTQMSYINLGTTDPGNGSNGPYTVIGHPGGACNEEDNAVNVYRVSIGSPGQGLPVMDPSSAATPLERTFYGAMGWRWNDLLLPCNLMTFDAQSTHYPSRGPVTETLSQEVTSPTTTAETVGRWRAGATATATASFTPPAHWTAPVSVQETYFDFKVTFPAKGSDAILVVGPSGGTKYAVRMTLSESGKAGEYTGTLRAQRLTATGEMLYGLPEARFDESDAGRSPPVSIVLHDVLQESDTADCSDCSDEPGEEDNKLGSINWSMSLGLAPAGRPVGALKLHASAFSAAVYTPAALRLAAATDVTGELKVVRRSDGTLRQIRTGSSIFDVITPADDAVLPAGTFEVRYYPQAGSTPAVDGSGLHLPAGALIQRTRFSDPDGSGNRIRVERFSSGAQPVSTVEYAHASATNTWSLTEAGLRRTDRTVASLPGNEELVTTTITDLSTAVPAIVSQVAERMRTITVSGVAHRVMVERTVDPEGAALVSQWEYYTDPEGRLRMQSYQSHTGAWEYYQHGFSSAGGASNPVITRTASTSSPILNTPSYNAGPMRTVTETATNPALNDGDSVRDIQVFHFDNHSSLMTVTQTMSNPVVRGGQNYRLTRVARSLTGNLNPSLPSTVWETYQSYHDGPFAGRAAYHLDRAGVLTLTSYSLDEATRHTTQTVERGAPNAGATAVVDGTRTITVTGQNGGLISRQVMDVASGLTLGHETAMEWDARGRPTVIALTDGTLEERSYNLCCGLLESVTRHGLTTAYEYDDLGRKISETFAGVSTLYTYDALHRVTKTVRRGSDGSEILLSATKYDVAGRVIETTDARGEATAYEETHHSDGTVTRTTTAPDLSTVTEVTNRDGTLASRSGSQVAPAYWTYTPTTYSGLPVLETRLNKAQPGQPATEWIKTYTDALGRVLATEYPDGAKVTSSYNSKDQLIEQVDPDGVRTLLAYNARGELETQAIDMNRNGVIDYPGSDRITRTSRTVVTAHGTTVVRVATSVWAAQGSDTAQVLSLNETSADGLQTWATVNGLVTHTAIAHAPNGTRTLTTTDADGTLSVLTSVNGRQTSSAVSHPSLGSLGSTTYEYDAHGRLQSSTDGRTGATTYTYYDDDQVHTVTTPDPDDTRAGDGYDPQVTTIVYDDMGRVSHVTQPDGGIVHTTYWPTGQVKRTWGARAYPTEYTYDEQGRVKTLTTWQDFAGDAGKAVTTWNYDPQRGWLTGKQHADGKGPTYTYTPAGRQATQRWARPALNATRYGYDGAGNLASIIYSDSTPEAAFTYDRLGRLLTRADSAGTCTYAYQGLTRLVTGETYTGGLLNGLAVSRGYDSLLRPESLAAVSTSSALNQVGYAYDPASRLTAVTSGTNTATYAYMPDSPLVSSVTFGEGGVTRLVTSKTYDNLNRLSVVSNQLPAISAQLSVAYTYNSANQRTRARREDNSRWDYGYDALGQVTSAAKTRADAAPVLGHSFAYAFDDIGNRKSLISNGLAFGYTATLLNQYAARTVPSAIELLGSADPAATVTADAAAVQRQESLFYNQRPVDNAGTARYQTLMVQGTKAGITVSEQRGTFVPKTPEQFTHDADGNLSQDGQWNYTWDAGNRLVEMRTRAEAVTAGAPQRRLVFTYDSLGRRIAKRVMAWDATAQAWGVQSSRLFLYDGWNLVAEIGTTGVVVRSYVWGLDLSGSIQGAGGVGGLLIANSDSGTHAPALDGNGNLIGCVDLATGTKSASFEYGAFGETLIADGVAADAMPFRFSTKYQDSETGLLYYGFRYYNSSTGRWLSRDPKKEQGGVNLYGFVLNNPLRHIDAFGLSPFDTYFRLNAAVDQAKQACNCYKDVVVRLAALQNGFGINNRDFQRLLEEVRAGFDDIKSGYEEPFEKAGQIALLNRIIARLNGYERAYEVNTEGGFEKLPSALDFEQRLAELKDKVGYAETTKILGRTSKLLDLGESLSRRDAVDFTLTLFNLLPSNGIPFGPGYLRDAHRGAKQALSNVAPNIMEQRLDALATACNNGSGLGREAVDERLRNVEKDVFKDLIDF